jgi:hypothetical protein
MTSVNLPVEALNTERNTFALMCGLVGGVIPNNKSNINPVLMGFIISILATKVMYGDYDNGYQWTINDIYFVIVVGGLGSFGAWVSSSSSHAIKKAV